MQILGLARIVIILLVASAPLHAQAPDAPASPSPPENKSVFTKLSNAFSGPLHPVVKGVASGGGIGVGIGYDFPIRGRWETTARAVVTIRRYWSAEVEGAYRGDPVQFEVYGRLREMTQLNFFGQGIDSLLASRTNFLLRDPVIGALASVRLAEWMAVGGRVEQLWPEVGSGHSTKYPTIEARFSEDEAPGLTAQPSFRRYQAFAEFRTPAGVGQALNQGGKYRIVYGVFDDRQLDRFTFNRFDLEALHTFALLGAHRRLTLHGWLAATDADDGKEIPFFLQPTLGGTGQLRSLGEDLIGLDGTRGTLRGFRNFRFRDRNLLLLQAEYRVPVWGPFDAMAFVDAGTVAATRSELSLANLKHNYGIGVSVMRGPTAVLRSDLGFGGGEGAKWSVTFGVGGNFLP